MLWLALAVLALAVMPLDKKIGISLVWGISVCLLPTICFAWYSFRYRGGQVVASVVAAFYRAETVKFLLTGMLFAAVFNRADQINLSIFFAAFCVTQILCWSLSAITLKQSR